MCTMMIFDIIVPAVLPLCAHGKHMQRRVLLYTWTACEVMCTVPAK